MLKRLSIQITNVSKRIGWVCGFLSAIFTICLIVMTVSDIFLRFFFSKPINGCFELTEYLMIPIVFLALPLTTSRNAHVRVDLLTGKLRRRKKAALYSVSCFLSSCIIFLCGWYTFPEAMYAKEIMFKSDMLDIPTYPFYFIIMIGFFLLFFTLIADFIQYIDKAVTK